MRDGLSRGLLETLIVLVGLVLIVLDATGTVQGQLGGGTCLGAGLGSIAQRKRVLSKTDDEPEAP